MEHVDTRKYCLDPVSTNLKVGFGVVLIPVAALLIYTPHALSETCPVHAEGATGR